MEVSGAGKSPNTSLSFRYNANNEELEELLDCEDDPPTPVDASPSMRSESASPKKGDKNPSILDKYFKSMRAADKLASEKEKEDKLAENKGADENRSPPKEVTSSPVKDYLKNLGKKSVSESADVKDIGGNETWKIFHDFKYKIAQAVEDMKTRSLEETKEKEKSVLRDSSISDSEENSVIKDSDQSVGDTDNQVSSLNSSIQNLSEITQPLTAKATENDLSLPFDKNASETSDDTPKNLVQSEMAHVKKDNSDETNAVEVESGVEALEDNIDGFSDATHALFNSPNKTIEQSKVPPKSPLTIPTNFIQTPSQINYPKKEEEKESKPFFTLTLYFITIFVSVNFFLFPEYTLWNGFLLGIWVYYIVSNFKDWVLANFFGDSWETNKRSFIQLNRSSAMPVTYTIPSVKEYRPIKKYEGWVNHYRFPEYDPLVYTINKTTTAFMKLEGCNLRISYTTTKIPKRALWDEKLEKVEFYQHRLYNLTGAKIILQPKGLAKRRQWSKKYPICVILNENEKIQVLEKESIVNDKRMSEVSDKKKEQPSLHEMESAETNTSPEKKKKFVWRRKDKSPATTTTPASHTESEVGREGLRHRLVRKKHKDKKSEGVATVEQNPEAQQGQSQPEKALQEDQAFHDAESDLATKSNTSNKEEYEEELDEAELAKIKEVLEQTELDTPTLPGTSEGEWSVHVMHARDKHGYLFLFTRTGRDKHEWFRRLSIAAADAAQSKSAETSVAEDKSASDAAQENKEGIEMAVYKVTDKDNVNFARRDTAKSQILLDGGVEGPAFGSCEETFWPFLLKIIENHELSRNTKSEVGIMCELEPSPRKNSKYKKKSKEQKSQQQNTACECRILPSEVTWVNTVMARVIYDLIHNPAILRRMQARIQRKLATLKLPSFMSPLLVTDLSLAGACPLVERVSAPAWDERGVWLDADLRYDGGAYISILTQINLMKLKEKNVALEDQLHASPTIENHTEPIGQESVSGTESSVRRMKPAVYDSDLEDSAESSDDDDSPPLQPVDSNDNLPQQSEYPLTASESTTPGSSKKKFLRIVDKIAMNKYFQQVTDYKYVKRAMEGLSNTDIKLQLELQGLEGRLAINFPPPPHDRVWFGFRTNPQLVLKARPAVGARTLRFAQISNWIEEKLSKEFEKILVLPNMEDIILDVMTPTPVDAD